LEPEKSLNLNGGFTSGISKNIYLTVDAYWIQVKNRIVISGNFDRTTNPEVDSLLEPFPEIDVVSFFTNAINTRTTGVDVVLHGKWKIQKSDFGIVFAANFSAGTQSRCG
jgi:iron complex outermembrane receptor protein